MGGAAQEARGPRDAAGNEQSLTLPTPVAFPHLPLHAPTVPLGFLFIAAALSASGRRILNATPLLC
jgi:hypothetical protein